MAEYRTTICEHRHSHPSVEEAYFCARSRLHQLGRFARDQPTVPNSSGTPLFRTTRANGEELTHEEGLKLATARRKWAAMYG